MRCLTTWSTPLLVRNLSLWKEDLKRLNTPSGECVSKGQIASLMEAIRLHQDMITLMEAILASRA